LLLLAADRASLGRSAPPLPALADKDRWASRRRFGEFALTRPGSSIDNKGLIYSHVR
jgi:hypothetical protein